MRGTMKSIFLLLCIAVLTAPARALAHCDGLDGPVVKAAQNALATGNVNLALVWVRKVDEGEIREAFERALAVRTLNPRARELADRYFFETLVRVHRTGEGAPYTGLKPAGRDLRTAIPAGDEAIKTGSAEPALRLLTEQTRAGIRVRFQEVLAKNDFPDRNVEAGREYVKAYVEFIHYIEQLYRSARGSPTDHPHESGGR